MLFMYRVAFRIYIILTYQKKKKNLATIQNQQVALKNHHPKEIENLKQLNVCLMGFGCMQRERVG